jgi:hypothetical protein
MNQSIQDPKKIQSLIHILLGNVVLTSSSIKLQGDELSDTCDMVWNLEQERYDFPSSSERLLDTKALRSSSSTSLSHAYRSSSYFFFCRVLLHYDDEQ